MDFADHVLRKQLTVIEGFRSHLEALWLIKPYQLNKQVCVLIENPNLNFAVYLNACIYKNNCIHSIYVMIKTSDIAEMLMY